MIMGMLLPQYNIEIKLNTGPKIKCKTKNGGFLVVASKVELGGNEAVNALNLDQKTNQLR